ncbi:kinase-like domain-containing protein [Aspergillus aurantiobrunneus]
MRMKNHYSPPFHRFFSSSPPPRANLRIATPDPDFNVHPRIYTSGRWLSRNHLEIDARYVRFDFGALCRRVLTLCLDASTIASCRKIEGGFNRVFVFTLDNGKNLVARLPFRVAGPESLTTASEVATVRYLQAKTKIPIPNVLDWNDAKDSNNAIGSEYIIMEHAAGVPLCEAWHNMAGDQQVRCIDAIYRSVKEMVELEFSAFGSIYFDSTPGVGSKHPLGGGFCIGPHCGTQYWDREDKRVQRNHGPWQDIGEYSDGLIDAGLARIPVVDAHAESGKRQIYHGSTESHRSLLERARPVLKQMSQDPRIRDSAAPLLFHPDLHMRNIFVSKDSPSTITGIIDWQAASIEPAFWYSDEVPDFATRDEINNKAFEYTSQFLTPKLSAPRLMNDNLFRPFRYTPRTWKDGAAAFRHELIETARLWKELGFEGRCPYPLPTVEELANHQKEYRLSKAAHGLRTDLARLLGVATDGWAPADRDWEEIEREHRELFDGMLQAVLTNPDLDEDEPVRDEMTLRAIWPFDIDW